MAYTRKNRKGGGIFNLLTGKSKNATTPSVSNLQAKRNYNLKHSKSRVANVLSAPGQVKYTNKERIESEYKKAIDELKKIEKPAETASALRSLASSLEAALKSNTAKTATAITITLPVGVAQLAYKAMLLFIAALAFVFIDLPSMGSIPVSAYIVPNKGFNTTQSAYESAKRFTGAAGNTGVVEY